jgi:urea carboxylase-associated protein 1
MYEIRKGQTFRILDLEGNQAADTLFYNAHDYEDRYSAQDTIRDRGNIYLTTGTKLRSLKGHTLLTIVADTCGRHDTLGGACATESNMVRYAIEKRHMHACRQSFVKAITEWGRGLDKRDIGQISTFTNVPVTRGWADVRGRRRAREIRGDAGRDGRAGAGQQLPAVEQPLQRLYPDADPP